MPHNNHMSQWLSCVVIVAAILALPATTYAQTLQQELKSLLSEHPRIRAAEAVSKREAEGVTSAFSGFLPKVALTGDYGREEIDNPTRRNTGLGTSELNRNKATLTVAQNVFDGLKTPEAVKAAELRKKAAEEN